MLEHGVVKTTKGPESCSNRGKGKSAEQKISKRGKRGAGLIVGTSPDSVSTFPLSSSPPCQQHQNSPFIITSEIESAVSSKCDQFSFLTHINVSRNFAHPIPLHFDLPPTNSHPSSRGALRQEAIEPERP
jgi:hypothetical protein